MFEPHVKRKRGTQQLDINNPPMPPLTAEKSVGIFTGFSVEVVDNAAIGQLYDNGYYGKGSHSRGAPKILTHKKAVNSETLVLSLEEAFFLSFVVKTLRINDMDGVELPWTQFTELAAALNPNFIDHIAAYLYLKAKGWVIKSGLKYGGDFLLYKKGPRFYHASYVVLVVSNRDPTIFKLQNFKALQRVAETSHKHVLLLAVTKPEHFVPVETADFQTISVRELIVERVNLKNYANKLHARKYSNFVYRWMYI